jgi:hypothetical protein
MGKEEGWEKGRNRKKGSIDPVVRPRRITSLASAGIIYAVDKSMRGLHVTVWKSSATSSPSLSPFDLFSPSLRILSDVFSKV